MSGVGTGRGFLIASIFSEKPEVRSLREHDNGGEKPLEVEGEIRNSPEGEMNRPIKQHVSS